MIRYLGHPLTLLHNLGEFSVFVDDVGSIVLGIRKGDDWTFATMTDVDRTRQAIAEARAYARTRAREEAADAAR